VTLRPRVSSGLLHSVQQKSVVEHEYLLDHVVNRMGKGGCLVMRANADVLNCLLDVINGHAVQSGSVTGAKLARVANRGRSKYVRLDPSFSMVVLESEPNAKRWPEPLLHRFQKVSLLARDALSYALDLVCDLLPRDRDLSATTSWADSKFVAVCSEPRFARAFKTVLVERDTLHLSMLWEMIVALERRCGLSGAEPDQAPGDARFERILRKLLEDHAE
jgi:hypothetical protein